MSGSISTDIVYRRSGQEDTFGPRRNPFSSYHELFRWQGGIQKVLKGTKVTKVKGWPRLSIHRRLGRVLTMPASVSLAGLVRALGCASPAYQLALEQHMYHLIKRSEGTASGIWAFEIKSGKVLIVYTIMNQDHGVTSLSYARQSSTMPAKATNPYLSFGLRTPRGRLGRGKSWRQWGMNYI